MSKLSGGQIKSAEQITRLLDYYYMYILSISWTWAKFDRTQRTPLDQLKSLSINMLSKLPVQCARFFKMTNHPIFCRCSQRFALPS